MVTKFQYFLASLLLVAGLSTANAQEEWDPERLSEGQRVYLEIGSTGCSACHGKFAQGDLGIGPAIRGVDAVRIQNALEAAREMSFLLPIMTQEDVDNVAYYLTYLDTLHPVKATLRGEAFAPEEVTVPPDTDVQVVVENGNRTECSLQVEGRTDEPLLIEGRDIGAVVFRSPAEGAFNAFCSEIPDVVFTIRVEAPSPQ